MKYFILFFAVIVFTFYQSVNKLHAQDEKSSEEIFKPDSCRHYLGFGGGVTTGYGFSYRYWPSVFGLQANIAPHTSGSTQTLSTGLSFLYRLVQTELTGFYLYQGNHYHYRTNLWTPDGTANVGEWFNGAGIGFEFIWFERVSFNIMGGFAYYNTFTKVNMTGEAGIYFMF